MSEKFGVQPKQFQHSLKKISAISFTPARVDDLMLKNI
jgi:hypothetical protein